MDISTNRRPFWIIFDTGTEPPYYQDVHNLLALPKNAMLRYDYGKKHISDKAEEVAKDFANQKVTDILFIYAQGNKYTKGDELVKDSYPGPEEMIWIPVRLGTMELIPSAVDNRYYFDFSVTTYPAPDVASSNSIIRDLVSTGSVPFTKWVSISDRREDFERLKEGEPSTNWHAIVDKLGSYPSQFRNDIFLRIKQPFTKPSGQVLPTKLNKESDSEESKKSITRITQYYRIPESDRFSLGISSANPPPPNGYPGNRNLTVTPEEDGPLTLLSRPEVDLRRFSSSSIDFVANRSEDLDDRMTRVFFSTPKDESGWPNGANFELVFEVRKKTFRRVIALIAGVMGISLLALGQAIKDRPITSFLVTAISYILISWTVILLTNKLGFKL